MVAQLLDAAVARYPSKAASRSSAASCPGRLKKPVTALARFLVGTGFYDEDKGKHRHLIAAAEPLQQLEKMNAVLVRPKNPLPFIAAGAEMINCAVKLDLQWLRYLSPLPVL